MSYIFSLSRAEFPTKAVLFSSIETGITLLILRFMKNHFGPFTPNSFSQPLSPNMNVAYLYIFNSNKGHMASFHHFFEHKIDIMTTLKLDLKCNCQGFR